LYSKWHGFLGTIRGGKRKLQSISSVSAADLAVPENAREEFRKGQSALKENKLEEKAFHF
jgi:hypothetical protein